MKLFKTALAPFVWLFLLILSIIFFVVLLFGKSTDGKSTLSSIKSFLGFKDTADKTATSNTVENPSGIEIKTKTYPILYKTIQEIRYWRQSEEFVIAKGSLIYSDQSISKFNPFQGANPSSFTQEQYNEAEKELVECLPVFLLPNILINLKMSLLTPLTKDQAKDYFDNPKIASVDSENKIIKIGDVYRVVIKENFPVEVKRFNLDYFEIVQETLQAGQELFGTIDLAIPNVFPADTFQFIDQFQTIYMMVKVKDKTYTIPSSIISYIKPTGIVY